MSEGNAATVEAVELDIVGTFEAHLLLGVERSRIARFLEENLKGKDKIPMPGMRLQSGPVWWRHEIEERARRMYEEAGEPYGPTDSGFDRWVVERALRRAPAANVPREQLEEILQRKVPLAAARAAGVLTRKELEAKQAAEKLARELAKGGSG